MSLLAGTVHVFQAGPRGCPRRAQPSFPAYGLTAFWGRSCPVAPVVRGLAAAGGGPSGETPQRSPGPRGQTHGHAVSCPGLPPHCGNLGPVLGWRGPLYGFQGLLRAGGRVLPSVCMAAGASHCTLKMAESAGTGRGRHPGAPASRRAVLPGRVLLHLQGMVPWGVGDGLPQPSLPREPTGLSSGRARRMALRPLVLTEEAWLTPAQVCRTV